MIAELVKVIKSKIHQKKNFPGDSVMCNVQGFFRNVIDSELYALPGVLVVPPKNANLIFIPVGGNRKAGVCIAGHNYQITIQADQGETIIYSTTADGKTVKAQIYLDADGNINLNGNSKRLVTYGELNTALAGLVSALNSHTHGGVSSGTSSTAAPVPSFSLDISAAETETIRTGG
jgi:hypothetical protein